MKWKMLKKSRKAWKEDSCVKIEKQIKQDPSRLSSSKTKFPGIQTDEYKHAKNANMPLENEDKSTGGHNTGKNYTKSTN